MIVAELIEMLKTKQQDMRVVVNGYEGGYTDVGEAKEIRLKLNVNDEWYYGPHENTYNTDEPFDCLALCLER